MVEVVVVVVVEAKEVEEEEIEKNRCYLHALNSPEALPHVGNRLAVSTGNARKTVGTVENVQPIPRHLL